MCFCILWLPYVWPLVTKYLTVTHSTGSLFYQQFSSMSLIFPQYKWVFNWWKVLILKIAGPAGRHWLWMENWKDTGQSGLGSREVDETCRCRRNYSGEIFGRLRNNCREVINPTQLALWCAKTAGKNAKTELAQAGRNLARAVVNVGSVA